ncbi:MAG: hypothetical protein HY650_07930 [Acidobacteria bacterium]|nr:hypothetical protein [Acidobacteriota bacterium]
MGIWIARLLFAAIIVGAPAGVSVASAQQRPLLTENVELVRTGSVRLELGFDFLQSQRFALSGLGGDLTRIGVFGLRLGVAPNVEVEISGVLQDFLAIDRRDPSAIPLTLPRANSTNDLGDFQLHTKVLMRREGKHWPAIGLRLGVGLPNTNQARGLGANQTNVFASVIAGKHFGRLNLSGNLGMAILPAPLEQFSQNDLLLYGLAGIWTVNDRLNLVGEINGRENLRGRSVPLGTESQGQGRFGMQLRAGGLRWDLAGIKGFNTYSPRSGVTFGMTYEFPIFEPVK